MDQGWSYHDPYSPFYIIYQNKIGKKCFKRNSGGLFLIAQVALRTTSEQSAKYLVGGFNPFEKYARQTGSFPQVGMKIKDI